MLHEPSRRAALGGLAAATVCGPAMASNDPQRHPGFSPWERVRRGKGNLPLTAPVVLPGGEVSVESWLGGRPAVLVLWASWCGPCLADKPGQARMAARLEAAGARTRIVSVRAFDEADDKVAAWRLRRTGAGHIDNARATPAFEAQMLGWFGRSSVEKNRTAMPSLALIDGDGRTLGHSKGRLFTAKDEDWWELPRAYDFLSSLR